MKHIFIVNNVTASDKILKVIPNIEKICKEENIDYEIRYSTIENNVDKQTSDLKDKEYIVFGVGGDGTVNLILNEIIGTKNMIGILPVGSGNDFYKILNKTDKLHIGVDIGKVNNKYFINTACFGIDAEIAANTPLMKKYRIPGSQLYNASILYTFFKYKNKQLHFYNNSIDEHGKYATLAICNGEYYGGGYHIAPKAKIDDGSFDIYYAGDLKKRKLPSLILKLRKGVHEESGLVKRMEDNKLTVESPNEIACNIDGETIRSDKFVVELISKGITVYNNKELINKFLNE